MSRTTRTLALALAAAGLGTVAAVAIPAIGSAATTSSNLQASVAADGTLTSGNRVLSSVAVGAGQYEVTFNRDVSGCGYVATTVSGASQALQAFTASGHGSARGVFVETKNQGGGLTAGAFDLIVSCGGSATSPFAVVAADGGLARSSAGVAAITPEPGRFELAFPSAVSSCVFLASVGAPGPAVVVDPTNVSTGLGSAANRVVVETKNPGGGLQPGVPFHLVVFCPGALNVDGAGVNGAGLAVRSIGDALSFRSGEGRYTVVTRRDISACATVATRGSLSTSAPFVPTTLETTTNPGSNTVGLQVRALLGNGGKFTSQPFYTATVC